MSTPGEAMRLALRRHIKGIRAIGRACRPSAARLAVSCVLGVLVVFTPSAWAAGTLYMSDIESDAVSAYSIAANGSLSGVPGSPFKAAVPLGVAVTPDDKYLYVADFTNSGGVSAFSIAANGSLSPIAGSPFPAEPGTWGLAITPDGKHLFVANEGENDVSAYSIESNGSLSPVPGSPFAAGRGPTWLAITPNGQYLYAANQESNNVSAFSIAGDGALSPVSGSPYPAGENPRNMSLTPDGKYLYVANQTSEKITAFSIAADGTLSPVAGSPFPSLYDQHGIAVTPDGKLLYASSAANAEDIAAFSIAQDGALSAVPGSPFAPRGDKPMGVAVTPDSKYLYAANYGEFEGLSKEPELGQPSTSALSIGSEGSLSAVPGSPFFSTPHATPYGPIEPAVSPDEGPEAAFSRTPAPASDPSRFNAAASSDPDYPLASYKWEFGDGDTETTSSASTTHTYAAAGTYTATLTVTDEAGCSMTQVFTGQTVSCNGSSQAQISQQVTVPPGVRLGVSRTGSGSGTVTSAPSGVQCGGICSYAFGEAEKVKLTENPEPGSAFAGWSGACSGEEATCEVTMSEASEVKAAFNALPMVSTPVTASETPLSSVPQTVLPSAVVVTGSVSLDGSTIAVQSGGEAQVKLTCTGTGTCSGKLSLTVKLAIGKGKRSKTKAQTKTEVIGTAGFSIPAGKTATIELALNGAGRKLLGAAHGHLSAGLTIIKSSPAPSQTQTNSVHLAQQKAHGKATK
jgi:6-phosphogluconolactonase (cycloisomerase 2 family)/PKD repeat protein